MAKSLLLLQVSSSCIFGYEWKKTQCWTWAKLGCSALFANYSMNYIIYSYLSNKRTRQCRLVRKQSHLYMGFSGYFAMYSFSLFKHCFFLVIIVVIFCTVIANKSWMTLRPFDILSHFSHLWHGICSAFQKLIRPWHKRQKATIQKFKEIETDS